MAELFSKGHAEPLETGIEAKWPRWYLAHFSVFHPYKPDNICVAFNGSAIYHDVSLNKVLLPDIDLMNCLFGVLVRFRQEPISIMADVQQRIHQSTSPFQWNYMAIDINSADLATRFVKAYDLMESIQLSGPRFLWDFELPIKPTFPAVELVCNPDYFP